MKVAVLWTCLSGYLNACLKELASRQGVELMVCHQAPSQDAPYDESQFAWIQRRITWRTTADIRSLDEQLRAYDPDVIVLAGWHIPQYRRAARELRGRCWRVMCMDNTWRGTLKQWLGVVTAPVFLSQIADAIWLPGERQAVFAQKLGFPIRRILWGLYSCDHSSFARVHEERITSALAVPRAFLFIGRFVEAKGVAMLADAYRRYRTRSEDPWPLICCGAGPLAGYLKDQPGARVEGFVQPDQIPAKMSEAGCFVLPSSFEPWALALHEAASAGLILLASERVGAAVHLLQPSFNGYLFSSGDAENLTTQMTRVSMLSDQQRETMSRASYMLGQQYTPERWANTLIDEYSAQQGILTPR